MARHVRIRHTERVDADLNIRLAEDQCARDKLEDFINAGIRHRITTDRHAGTVNHQVFPFVTVRTVEGIGETDVNRFIEPAVRF